MKNRIITLFLLSFIFSSCSSSYLKDSTNVSNTKKQYDKILVIARAKDKTTRINFENQVVKDFAENGVNATSSRDIFQSENFERELSEKEIEELRLSLVKKGYGGVVITNLISKDQYTDVVPGSTSTAYVPVRYGRFGRYYGTYPMSYWEPDQVKVGIQYTLESCFYDIRQNLNDNLQWVGRFQLKDPKSLTKSINKYSKELTENLMLESIAQ
jgi:hypothetical protein